MRAVIFANGILERPQALAEILKPGDHLIAADGGLKHIRAMNLVPDMIVGDLDSVSKKDLAWLEARKVEIMQFPEDKDYTDLELALREVHKRGFRQILIAAGLGGRADQTQANIALLSLPELSDCEIALEDGVTEMRLIVDTLTIQGSPGDTVSLLPLCQPALEVVTERLKYSLRSEKLEPGQTRGISNVMLKNSAQVSLKKGRLLCVHIRQEKYEKWS